MIIQICVGVVARGRVYERGRIICEELIINNLIMKMN